VPFRIVVDEPADGVIVERHQASRIAKKSFARQRQIDAQLASPETRLEQVG
jgi:hypothetical protein